MDVAVKLEIFEGPLDLLLHLIRKNEVDIYDIPVALITSQYLKYLDALREMNIHVAGDFLVMASTLTHLKSRMLLPARDSSDQDEEGDDPRLDLVEQLKEHMRFKAAADQLSERMWLDRDVFARAAARREVDQAHEAVPEPAPVEAGLFDLIEAFQSLLRKQGRRVNLALPDPGVSLELRMSQLLGLLRARRTLTFEECFAGDRDRPALVVSFLALLELTRVGLIRIYQERRQADDQKHGQWGPLRIFFQDPAEEEGGES